MSGKRILIVLVGLTFAFQLFSQDYRVCEYGLKVPVELVMPRHSFSQCDYSPWILVFDDEFDGNSLDMSKWNYGPRTRYSNNEQQYYTHGENIEVSGGTLKLIAKRDTLYARAADWFDDDGIITRCGSHYEDVDLSEDFHIYTLIWEKYRIEWYVDGKLKWKVCRYYNKDGRATDCFIDAMREYLLNGLFPQDPMNIILNFAIQDGINSPDNITVFPSQMEVDWVRYYQR